MTSQQQTTELAPLTRKDLAAFDKDAVDLLLEMQAHGWRGYITANQHAVMRHPDGSHQSLTRSSNRAKSGTAMRSRFEAWKRRNADREKASTSAFGQIPEEPVSMPVPVATLLEMKKHPVLGAAIGERDLSENWAIVGKYETDPRAWAVFDTGPSYPVLVGHGSALTEAEAWQVLMEDHAHLLPEPDPQPQGTVGENDQEDVMASVYVCPEPGCGKQFSDQRRASVHNASSHHREQVTCDVTGCGWTGDKNSAKRHHDKMHDTSVHPCPFCGSEYTTPTGLAMHRARKHKGQVPEPVTVTHQDVTVTSPVSSEVTGGDATVVSHAGDVLLDHLEHLPEGEDAEAMIARVRSVVAGPLVAEVRRLREELALVTGERDKFRTEAADFEARLTLMREVMGV